MRFRSLILLLAPLSLQAQISRDSTFSVTANRMSHVVADRVSFYVVVEGTAETAPDAVARADTKLKTVLEALRTWGARIEVDAPIGYSVGPTQSQNGYPMPASPATNLARSVIRVQLSRIEQLSKTIGAAIAAGASSTSTVSFESSSADSVRRARLAETIAAARADAEAMATALGGHLGALVDASSTASPTFQQPPTLNLDGRFGSQYAAPEVAITTSATLRFRLVR
jgi:uncharacterized protein YggE